MSISPPELTDTTECFPLADRAKLPSRSCRILLTLGHPLSLQSINPAK